MMTQFNLKSQILKTIFLLMFVEFWMISTLCNAEIIVVDQEGGGDKLRIQQAINSASVGDEILIRPGLYDEQINIDKSIMIYGSDPAVCKIVYTGQGDAITFLSSSRDAKILRLSITSLGGNGILCQDGASTTIKNCIIQGNTDSGIYIETRGTTSGPVISNCVIVSNRNYGIYFSNYPHSLSNSIIMSNSTGVGWYRKSTSRTYFPSSFFNFNNVWGNRNYAYFLKWDDHGKITDIPIHSISKDPEFKDPNKGDFHLKPTSPCIDAGWDNLVYADPDGTRNDMGAYGGPDAPVPKPIAAPTDFRILSIVDVPNDQGRKVRMSWERHTNDSANSNPQVSSYSIWRKFDPELPAVRAKILNSDFGINPEGDWTFLTEIPAAGTDSYSTIVSTLADSTVGSGVYFSTYFIRVHTTDLATTFNCNPDSGYSVDNLEPHTPENFAISTSGSRAKLVWDQIPDPDLAYYAIYRGATPNFEPTEIYEIATEPEFEDAIDEDYPFYRISAFDFSGNQSSLSSSLEVISGDIPLPLSEGHVFIDFDLTDGDQGLRAVGGAISGKVYDIQLNVVDVTEINGWSITIDYDPTQVRYVNGSFAAGDFIPGLLPLSDNKEGSVSVGGAVLGSSALNSGDGVIGQLSFEVLDGFTGSTDLIITENSFRFESGGSERYAVQFIATITSEPVEPVIVGDFDGSGKVDFMDFFLFADGFGGTDPQFDLDNSGAVDFSDFFIFADSFGKEEKAKLIALAHEYFGLPVSARLGQNYPNPFNTSTMIQYQIVKSDLVQLNVYNIKGQKIKVLVNSYQKSGQHQITWDGTNDQRIKASTGIYLIKFDVGNYTEVKKTILVK